jgi:hypothetical protein
MEKPKPRVLVLDIETSPIVSYTWGLFDQNVGLNQIKEDWYVLSFAAKWLGEKEVIYMDQSGAKDIKDDRKLVKEIWKLLDACDVIIAQNGNSFDVKKLNARFLLNGLQPPSSYRKIDTYLIAKKFFSLTSNKLEYMTDKLCTKYKKLKHGAFSGFELWKEVLAGNKKAWLEMKKYNINDVLSLEELYHKLIPWDSSLNFNVYHDSSDIQCKCGNNVLVRNGFFYTNTGKFQRYRCVKCGAETHDRTNLFDTAKRKSLHASSK